MTTLSPDTRATVLKRLSELEGKAIARLELLEVSGAFTGDESAGLIMAHLTAELADGYGFDRDPQFKNLRRF